MEESELKVLERLKAYGVDLEDAPAGGRDGWLRPESGRFTVTADALEELLRRTDPVEAARDALAFVYERSPASREDYEDARDQALEEIRQGVAVTDAELRVRCAPDPESF